MWIFSFLSTFVEETFFPLLHAFGILVFNSDCGCVGLSPGTMPCSVGLCIYFVPEPRWFCYYGSAVQFEGRYVLSSIAFYS